MTTDTRVRHADMFTLSAAVVALLSVPVLGIVALAILVAGFLGRLLGSAVLRKHFARAGLA